MQGAAAFFLAPSRNGAASCTGGVAGAGACCALTTPPVSPASAAKKDIAASLRKRVRLPTVRLEAYHFCARDSRHALCLRIAQKSGALSRPAFALPLLCLGDASGLSDGLRRHHLHRGTLRPHRRESL